MENIIKIENKNLANYIMFKLDKVDNSFTEQELNTITEVVIDYNNETDSSFLFLEELSKLKNIKYITLRNGYIFNDNYNLIILWVNFIYCVMDMLLIKHMQIIICHFLEASQN